MGLYTNYKYPLIGAGLGLLLAILFICFGFLKTILILVLVILGFLAGLYFEKIGLVDKVRSYLNRK